MFIWEFPININPGLFCEEILKNRISLLAFGIFVSSFLLSGCAAGKVYLAKNGDGQASCLTLDHQLGLAKNKIKALEDKDHTWKNLRDAALSAAGLAFPPLIILNVVLVLNDSHVADLAETETLRTRYNRMVSISNAKECGLEFAMIPENKL